MNLLLFRGRPAEVRYVYRCEAAGCTHLVHAGRLACPEHTTDEQFFAQLGATPGYRIAVLWNRWRGQYRDEGARA